MIDHDARPALICVPNSAELPGPSRANALTSAAGLSAEDRGDDDVDHRAARDGSLAGAVAGPRRQAEGWPCPRFVDTGYAAS